jgi:predicted dehydrogenase
MCDVSRERAEEYASRYGARAFTSYDELLANPNVDAVSICTPSGMHADQAITALRAGKHVLLEKPMALTARDALRIREAEAEYGKLVSVVFQTRYVEDIRYLKGLIDDGRFGTLAFCDLYMKYWRDPTYYSASPWRGTFAMDGGGALMNQGIHGVDVMHFLFGEAKLIGARVKTLVHDIETEDTAAAVVEYPSGALGVIEASTSANPGFSRKIEINGSRGYAIVNDASIVKLVLDGETLVDKEMKTDIGTASDPGKMSADKHAMQIRNFIDATRGEAELISNSYNGYTAVKFIEDIYNFK